MARNGPASSLPGGWQLALLGGWRLYRDGVAVSVSRSTQRLVALVALRGPSSRPVARGTLWPEASEPRAAANLRAALYRARRALPCVLLIRDDEIMLDPAVVVDVDLLTRPAPACDDDSYWMQLTERAHEELLPGWYDDWVLIEAERIRQLWLHAMENRAEAFLERQDYGRALDTALRVARIEPTRESAQRLVIDSHLAEGNVVEAMRTYDSFAAKMRRELGVGPSAKLRDLVADLRSRNGSAGIRGAGFERSVRD